MRAFVSAVVSLGVFIPLSAPGQAPASRPSAEAGELVERLRDEEWKVRQDAQDQLTVLGDEARPVLLSVAKASHDEEVRSRAEAALRQIEENRMAGPSFVTIRLKDAHPRAAFESLAKQAQADFRVVPDSLWSEQWPGISVDIARKPFWYAMRELTDKTGLAPQCGYSSGGDRRMVLTRSGAQWASAPYTICGPFMVVATQIHRANTVNLTMPNGERHEFTMQFMVYGEPKLRVMQYCSTMKLDEAVDEKGNSLLPDDGNESTFTTGASWAWNLSARLQYPRNPGTRIEKLKGSAQFIVQTRAQTIEIKDILSAKEVNNTVEGKQYTLKQAQKQGDQFAVTVVFHRDARTDSEWSSFQSTAYQTGGVQLADDKGRMLGFAGSGASSSSHDTMEVTYQFTRGDEAPTGEPVKLLWEIPLETRLVAAPFEFSKLPLP